MPKRRNSRDDGQQRPKITVSVERAPKSIEFPTRVAPVRGAAVQAWDTRERGRVRLVIDMPAARAWWGLGVMTGVFTLAIIPLVVCSVLSADGPGAYAFPALAYGTILISLVLVFRPGSKREVLEIDTRFVTLSLDDALVTVLGREQFLDVRLNEQPNPTIAGKLAPARAPWPTIVWGTNVFGGPQEFMAGAGSGISREAASELLVKIHEFCSQYPSDDDHPYRGAGAPMGARQV